MIHVAVLGYGVVGSGVVEVLEGNGATIAERAGRDIYVKTIVDVRDFSSDRYAARITADFGAVERDPDIKIVVETIGGRGVAYDFTKRSLSAGKSVVTSNKELVAAHGVELFELARANGVSYMFEASVGGGIPIIRPIYQCLAANDISEIYGILNGTTNYILTRMFMAGVSFEQALAEAQAHGYAEADPTADIEGHDTCRKICILAGLAFGRQIYPEWIRTEGITKITGDDVAYAAGMGCAIKLLGRAVRQPDGRVYACVAPHLLPGDSPLAPIRDVFNGICVRGNAIDEAMFYGRGAGKLPTASAVVADIIDAVRNIEHPKFVAWGAGENADIADWRGISHAFFVRLHNSDTAGASASARAAFGDIREIARPEGCDEQTIGFVTPVMTESAFISNLGKLNGEAAGWMRLLG